MSTFQILFPSSSADSGQQPVMLNLGFDANWRMNVREARQWHLVLFSIVCFGEQ